MSLGGVPDLLLRRPLRMAVRRMFLVIRRAPTMNISDTTIRSTEAITRRGSLRSSSNEVS